jgi:hypothetical protein
MLYQISYGLDQVWLGNWRNISIELKILEKGEGKAQAYENAFFSN